LAYSRYKSEKNIYLLTLSTAIVNISFRHHVSDSLATYGHFLYCDMVLYVCSHSFN